MSITPQQVEAFLRQYEAAAATYDFANVADLIHPEATFRFREGDFVGLDAIRGAFESTWNSWKIQDERYYLTDLKVVHTDENSASIAYKFHWSGVADGKPFSSDGRGTGVIVQNGGALQLVYEHLSD